jgi:hypothetical protein
VGWVDGPGRYVVNINPLTELAVRQLGMPGGDQGVASVQLSVAQWPSGDVPQDVLAVNARISQLFGLAGADLLASAVVPVIERDGQANAAANAYGRALAAVSGVERILGMTTVGAVDMLAQAMQSTATWDQAMHELVAGARAALVNTDVFAQQIGLELDTSAAQRQAVWDQIYAAADGRVGNALVLTGEQLSLIGVQGSWSAAQLRLLGSAIDGLQRAQVDSVDELQRLAQARSGRGAESARPVALGRAGRGRQQPGPAARAHGGCRWRRQRGRFGGGIAAGGRRDQHAGRLRQRHAGRHAGRRCD